jgi:hypothetical protein
MMPLRGTVLFNGTSASRTSAHGISTSTSTSSVGSGGSHQCCHRRHRRT